MSITRLEPWKDKRGIAEFFACSVSKVEQWTSMGMPSAMIAGRRKYRPSECEAWLERMGEIKEAV